MIAPLEWRAPAQENERMARLPYLDAEQLPPETATC